MTKPDFFIIGAPKTGTTAMAQFLSDHPAVFMATPKEPHHYNSDHKHGGFKDPAAYAALFRDAGAKTVGEASVFYLYSQVAVPRIEKECPNARYIVMLRSPLEMAPALYEQHVFSGYETSPSFEQAWELQEARDRGTALSPPGTDVQMLYYKRICQLGDQLQRLYKHVPRERVHIIFNNDFRAEPRRVWLEVQAFLELIDDGRYTFPVVNAAKKHKSMVVQHFKEAALTVRHTLHIPPLQTGFFRRLETWNLQERSRTPLPGAMHKKLQTAFREDIELLGQLTNTDLSDWLIAGD
ncbi:MAG: sulfotransferase [Rhodobacteraceae bacterium]|nr:sulfotransferase [Paracoccaceae bacterium]